MASAAFVTTPAGDGGALTTTKAIARGAAARARGIIWAFDEACKAVPHQPASEATRDMLAKFITRLAQDGEQSPGILRDRALEYLKSLAS